MDRKILNKRYNNVSDVLLNSRRKGSKRKLKFETVFITQSRAEKLHRQQLKI